MNVTDILLDIVVVLLAAKIAAEIAERVSVPPVIAEIVAGVIVGPAVLGIIHENRVIEVLGELGVILLLLEVGLELSISDLRSVGRSSLTIAGIGVVVPVALGIGVGIAWGESSNTAIFLGSALAATSVGITARVFSDLGALTRIESRAVLGAAVADDVLGLILLTIVVRVVTAGPSTCSTSPRSSRSHWRFSSSRSRSEPVSGRACSVSSIEPLAPQARSSRSRWRSRSDSRSSPTRLSSPPTSARLPPVSR